MQMKGFKYWFTILALVVALGVNNRAGAQEVLSTRSKKAVELYHKAQYFYDRYSYAMQKNSLYSKETFFAMVARRRYIVV